jgi:GTP-binding protein
LVQLIDASETAPDDAEHDFGVIMGELENFDVPLSHKPMLLVASRIDIAGDGRRLRSIEKLAADRNLELFPVSSVTGEGLDRLTWGIAKKLRELRAAESASGAPEHTGHDTTLLDPAPHGASASRHPVRAEERGVE